MLVGALALTATGAAAHPAAAAPPPPEQARLTLPVPTGRYPVGTVSLHLIDRARANPWTASPSHRELMVSIWYPARDARRYPVAPQMLPGAAAHLGKRVTLAQHCWPPRDG